MDMDMDSQEGFELFEESTEAQEPEWMQLNRQWTSEHPSVLFQKCPRSVLDGWVICESNEKSNPFLSTTFSCCDNKTKKCFIDKIDLKSLVEDPDSFNIDSLFAETDDHCSSCEYKSRKWMKSDEVKLLRFTNSRKTMNIEMWKRIALELGRSINSVRIKAAQLKRAQEHKSESLKKPTIHNMISSALDKFQDKKGTKDQIITKIEELYGNITQKCWKTSVKQLLNTSFKKIPGVYRLNCDKKNVDVKKCITMGDYIVWVLGKYGELKKSHIKDRIKEHFGKYLNDEVNQKGVQTWELTFVKKLKTCKFIDFSISKTMFMNS